MTPPPPVGRLLDLTGQVVVVTGVSGGIGQGIARRLGEAGASLVLHVRGDRSSAEVLAGELDERAIVVAGDLLEDGVADGLAAAAVDRFGRLDGWVNNAGVQPVAALMAMTAAEFDAVLAGNASTTFRGTQAAAQRMTEGGSIVNVASIEAIQPALGHSHYVASKAAVVAHSRAAAVELASAGVRVNAVAPGLIDRPGPRRGVAGRRRPLAGGVPARAARQPRRRRRRLPVPALGRLEMGDRSRARRRRRRAGPERPGERTVGSAPVAGPVSRRRYMVRRIGVA